MKVKNISYPDYQTARRWASKGFLPKNDAKGIELWSNRFCQKSYVYYSPDEVMRATKEQINNFLAPERERRRQQAKEWRERRKAAIKEAREQEEKEKQQELVEKIAAPHLRKIAELHKIIKSMSDQCKPTCVGSECFVIDTETTGLDPERDELLQLSIINDKGDIVYNSYFKPCAESWEDSQQINHINPAMVRNAPSIIEKIAEINAILCKADRIIGYNTRFDVTFLENNGIVFPDNVRILDAMKEFAIIYGDWSEYYQDYRYKKLTFAADYYGYDWNSRPEKAHNSLADCFATLFVYNKMNGNKAFSRR